MKNFPKIILSLGYAGLTPKCPGTAGSLATTVFLILLSLLMPDSFWLRVIVLAGLFVIVFWLSIYLIEKYISGNYDQQWIVIDEFLGMLLAAGSVFVLNLNLDWYFSALILFRFFDILKPLGLSKINKINKPFAVVIDDIIAGVYSFIVLFAIFYST